MRNYIILNDVNSNTINGLLIQELPPISKPKMRTQIEEIDGRAGDIVTQLGYAAYTKTISIGLYGDFDIDEVISYFNSAGTVVFSNEPDKYYNYEIIEQIDFNRLVRFRTAKVKMHVQPFKYPTEEEPLVAQYQLVTNTGSDMSLDNTANALFRKLDLKGNTSQTGTPTPDAPQPVNVVSGDNEISICGKNLLNRTSASENKGLAWALGTEVNETGSLTSDYIKVNIGDKYIQTYSSQVMFYDINKEYLGCLQSGGTTIAKATGNNFNSFTIPNVNDIYYMRLGYRANYSGNPSNMLDKSIMLNRGTTLLPYEPYTGETYPIYLGVDNLFDKNNVNSLVAYIPNNGTISYGADNTLIWIPIQQNTNYSIKLTQIALSTASSADDIQIGIYENTPALNTTGTRLLYQTRTSATEDYTYTYSFNSGTSNYLAVKVANSTKTDVSATLDTLEITKGSTPQHISTTPIELCKIGDNQDYLYKENGTWYLHKETGKVVFDGSETWSSNISGGKSIFYIQISGKNTGIGTMLSNYFKYNVGLNWQQIANGEMTGQSNSNYIFIRYDEITTLGNFKTWLGTNQPSVYFVLATPTNTEITDTDLIEQLEALKQANSYDGQTNISHEYNGSPFILDVAAVQKGTDTLVVNNEGNIYARPTLDIEGTGMVNVYLEGNQMFQVDLTDTNEIVIDTDEMEAYDPSTQALMNRQVTGNYDNFKIVAGNNNLKFSGDLTKATVTGYERWL